MAVTATCPELKDFSSESNCLEQFGGLGRNIYAFQKSDLKSPLKATGSKYAAPTTEMFNTGKGLVKFVCKDQENGHSFESLGPNKGYKQTLEYAFEAINEEGVELARALNNLDCGYIVQDGEKSIIVYDPNHKFEYASGGIKGETGKKAEDDRSFTLSGSLQPTAYGRYVIEEPTAGWDSLLASKKG